MVLEERDCMTNKYFIESVRLSRFIAIAFAISFFILYFAISISHLLNDWMLFSRSGSLLVCVGVITTAYNIQERISKNNTHNK
jgi:hypothetical protein